MIAIVLLSAVLAADPAPAVAFALEVRGSVTVARGGNPIELDDGDPIREGDKLAVPAGGSVAVYFRPTGPVAVLTGPADATVRPGKLESTAVVAVRDVKVPTRAAAGLDRDVKADLIGGLTMRDLVPSIPRITPASGRAVRSATPDFSWPPVLGAKGYKVELGRVIDEDKSEPVWTATTPEARLAYPSDRSPLSREPDRNKYVWKVLSVAAEGMTTPYIEAKFVVLDEHTEADLAAVAPLERSGDPNDWLIAAEAYTGARLTEEPIRLMERVAESRPGSALVWAKLGRLYRAAGRIEDKERAEAEAKKLGWPKK